MERLLDGKTKVIGHRGSPRHGLENTFESFDAAEAEGADGFELDVRLTSDGEVVLHHDPDILFGERRVPIATLTMPELAQTRVPTLRDVFLRYGADPLYLIELKAGPSPRPGLLEFRVATLLREFHLVARSTVLSFSAEMLRRIKETEPAIETCLNFEKAPDQGSGRLWPDLPAGCRAIGPFLFLVSDELFSGARAAGLGIHVWTVNEADMAEHLASVGAASVITDVPGEMGPVIRAVTGLPPPLFFGSPVAAA
jgi:glycerophosphoryl diester phosphodiesterase